MRKMHRNAKLWRGRRKRIWGVTVADDVVVGQVGHGLNRGRARIAHRAHQDCDGALLLLYRQQMEELNDGAHAQVFETKGRSVKEFGHVKIGQLLLLSLLLLLLLLLMLVVVCITTTTWSGGEWHYRHGLFVVGVAAADVKAFHSGLADRAQFGVRHFGGTHKAPHDALHELGVRERLPVPQVHRSQRRRPVPRHKQAAVRGVAGQQRLGKATVHGVVASGCESHCS